MPDATEAVIDLAVPIDQSERSISGRVTMWITDEVVTVDVTVPADPIPLQRLLPLFQGLTNAIVERAEARAQSAGKSVSCRAGCGACCRQAVPIAEPEAHALAALVAKMPEPRRAAVTARFAEAESHLAESGIAERHASWSSDDRETIGELGLAYFRQGIACPFLEDESCSIHQDRPLACREYLVVSDAEWCSTPDSGHVVGLPIAGKPSRAITSLGARRRPGRPLLMVEALTFAACDTDAPIERPGPEWMQDAFQRLAKG